MRHLARAPRDHLSVVRRPGRSRGATSTACARSARELETVPRRDPPKGTLRFYADAAAASRRSAAVRGRQVPIAAYRAAVRRAARRAAASTSSSATSCCRPSTCPPAAVPGRALHAQRRGGDLAASRRDRGPARLRRLLYRAQWRRMLRFEAARAARSTACWRSRKPTATRSSGSIPARCARPSHVVPTGVDTDVLLARRRAPPAPRHLVFTGSMDWLPNEDAMTLLLPRHPAAHPARGAGRDAHRSSAARRRRRSGGSAETRRRRDRAGWTMSGRTSARRRSTSCRSGSAAARGSRSSRRWPWARPSSRRRSAPRDCRSTTASTCSSPTSPQPSPARSSLLRDAERAAAARSGGARARRRALRLVGSRRRARRRAASRRQRHAGRLSSRASPVDRSGRAIGSLHAEVSTIMNVSVFGLGMSAVCRRRRSPPTATRSSASTSIRTRCRRQRGTQPDRRAGARRAARATASRQAAARDHRTPRKRSGRPTSRSSASARRAARTAASTSRISTASAEQIGDALSEKADYHVVVVRSTVLPGTTHDMVIPALEATSGKKYGEGFGVSVNPEFLREGTALKDFRTRR